MCHYFKREISKGQSLAQYKLYALQMAVKHSKFRDIGVHALHNSINLII